MVASLNNSVALVAMLISAVTVVENKDITALALLKVPAIAAPFLTAIIAVPIPTMALAVAFPCDINQPKDLITIGIVLVRPLTPTLTTKPIAPATCVKLSAN